MNAEQLADILQKTDSSQGRCDEAAAMLRKQDAAIKQIESELAEQCRINGMGAERELALLAKMGEALTKANKRIEQLERENAELRKDAERYRWLVANNKYWSWQPSAYNKELTSGFSAYATGYLGFPFEAAIDEAMK